MAAVLSEYLSAAAARPFCWAQFNCLHFLADWIRAVTGVEVAAQERLACRDQRSARALMKQAGGIDALIERCVTRAGCERVANTWAVERGDISLVMLPLKSFHGRMLMAPAGAIAIGRSLWAVKPADGRQLVVRSFSPVAVWIVPHG